MDLIFYRMHEPAFIAKGNDDVQRSFNVPDEFIDDRFKALKAYLAQKTENKNGDTDPKSNKMQEIALKKSSIPNLKFVLEVLKRADMFSLFMPMHRKIAVRLIEFFRKVKSLEDLQTYAVFARDHINPFLFSYTLSIALLNRTDTSDVMLPTAAELFPDRFLHSTVFQDAREELAVVPDDSRVTK